MNSRVSHTHKCKPTFATCYIHFLFVFNYILLFMLVQLSQFFPIAPPPPSLPTPSGNSHTFVRVHRSYIQVLWLLSSLCCTLHHCDYSATYLYFLTLLPFSQIPPTTLPSGNHQNVLCVYDSVSVLLVCLFCLFQNQLLIDMYLLLFYCSYC